MEDNSKIHFVTGDVTNPTIKGGKFICNMCNNMGVWNSNFHIALSKRWKQPEIAYRNMRERIFGHVDFVRVTPEIIVANMIVQHDIKPDEQGNPPIRYAAVRIALDKVNWMAYLFKSTVHIPKIGYSLAGGQWSEIEKILKEIMDVDVYVYDHK